MFLSILKGVFLIYLWSIDPEAVLVAMSCFSLLCEEADIRSPNDDFSYNSLLPNYFVYEVLLTSVLDGLIVNLIFELFWLNRS